MYFIVLSPSACERLLEQATFLHKPKQLMETARRELVLNHFSLFHQHLFVKKLVSFF